MPIVLWFFFEVIVFMVLSQFLGFLYTFLIYWVPVWLVFRVLQPQLLRYQLRPLTRIAWTLLGLPSFVTRFMGLLMLIPGVAHLLTRLTGSKLENQFKSWQQRPGFTRFYFSNGPTFYEPQPTEPHEMKDVTPISRPELPR